MKYDSMRKLKRDAELLRYAEAHPGAPLREIAEVYGVTRQRICQILAKAEKKQIEEALKAANPPTDNRERK